MQEREEFERLLDSERLTAISESFVNGGGSQALLKSVPSTVLSERSKSDAKERVKAKFRNRYAERVKNGTSDTATGATYSDSLSAHSRMRTHNPDTSSRKLRGNEEEMFQHVEFYERSLRAARQ